jgi:tRNA A37 threonylcarbamoyladenosine dehydratase
MNEFEYRFSGISRLYGQKELNLLNESHVLIVGIGGVGTWAAEAIARSGIGKITLVDLDDICVTNTNRQLIAQTGNIGKQKVQVMKERIELINPDCVVKAIANFFTKDSSKKILEDDYTIVIDCIDSVNNKALLIAASKRKKIPLIVCGGSAGKRDLTRIQVKDLNLSKGDQLINNVKEVLLKEYNFPIQKTPFRIKCIFSDEGRYFSQKDGTVCKDKVKDAKLKLDCASGLGTASFITGTFGFYAASEAIRQILNND